MKEGRNMLQLRISSK